MTRARILIVEDEAIVARDIRQQLLAMGYHAIADTTDGEQAVILAGHLRPDLVLMDVHLAGEMDGIAAAQAIRERLALPVVFLAAVADEETLGRAKLSEPFGFLIKPFDERELHTIIELALYKHQAETTLHHAREEQAAILRAAPDGFLLADMQGQLLDVNEASCQMTGYSHVELLQMSLADLEADESPGESAAVVDQIQPAGFVRLERQYRRKDGGLFYVEASVNYLANYGGRLVCFLRDVTERRRAEQVLRDLSGWFLRLQDEERRGIARELHDTTAQNLAALNMNLMLLERAAPPGNARLGELLADCQRLTDRSLQEIRTLSYLLHPPLLDELGLVRTIRDYAEGFSQRSGIRVELDAPDDLGRLPEAIEIVLFRVLQESLANVHRHSGSPVAEIRLAWDDRQVCMEIRDRGCGLPPGLINAQDSLGSAAGVGLLGMRERSRQLGGRLELESGLPGVRVRILIPLGSAR